MISSLKTRVVALVARMPSRLFSPWVMLRAEPISNKRSNNFFITEFINIQMFLYGMDLLVLLGFLLQKFKLSDLYTIGFLLGPS